MCLWEQPGSLLTQECQFLHLRIVGSAPAYPALFARARNGQWRCVMKKFIAVLALLAAFGVPLATQTATAAPVSPSSRDFGGNGY